MEACITKKEASEYFARLGSAEPFARNWIEMGRADCGPLIGQVDVPIGEILGTAQESGEIHFKAEDQGLNHLDLIDARAVSHEALIIGILQLLIEKELIAAVDLWALIE